MTETILLIDLGHMSIRGLFVARSISKTDWQVAYINILIKMINSTINKFKVHPKDIICALENRDNWRRDIDPIYKVQRALNREKDEFDWSTYFNLHNELIEALDKGTLMRFIGQDRCEGDDVIASLAMYIENNENFNTIIVSSDKDFKQLINLKTSVYDPMKDIIYVSEKCKCKQEIEGFAGIKPKTKMNPLLRGLI